MRKLLVLLAVVGFCAATLAQEDWVRSPFYVEDRVSLAFQGRADVEEGRLYLEYQFINISRETVELPLIRPDGERWQLVLPPRETEVLVVDQALELASPTEATRAFRARTYLMVYEEGAEAQILIPAEVAQFVFDVSMPGGARILSSSIPEEYLTGRVLADHDLRALPAVQVLLTMAPERIEIGILGEGQGPISVEVTNFGADHASGLTLAVLMEIIDETATVPDGWRVAGDDGVMRRWEYDLPDLDGGASFTLDLPGVAAGGTSRLRRVAVHNSAGDLIAVD